MVLDKSTATVLKSHKPKSLSSKQAFSMLASKMAAAPDLGNGEAGRSFGSSRVTS